MFSWLVNWLRSSIDAYRLGRLRAQQAEAAVRAEAEARYQKAIDRCSRMDSSLSPEERALAHKFLIANGWAARDGVPSFVWFHAVAYAKGAADLSGNPICQADGDG